MTFQEWQRGLIALGYDLGRGGPSGKGDDGIPGRKSIEATIAFKTKQGLSPTPAIGPLSIEAMRKALQGIGSATPVRRAIIADPGGLEPVHLIEARRWLGEREIPGPKSNPRILQGIRSVGAKILGIDYVNDDTAWCGAIMAVWVGQTLPSEPLPSIAVRAKSWEKFGVPLAEAVPGAVMTSTRKGGGHVMIAVAQTATHYLVIGGNQGNAVSFMLKAKADIDAIRYPSTLPAPRLKLPTLTTAEAKRYVAGLSEA